MRYVTHEQLHDALADLEERICRMEASQQGQVDAIVAELGTVKDDLANTQVTLQSEIDGLAAANPGVDLSALQAVADGLDPAVQKLAALTPTPPAPPAPPAA